MALHAKFVIAWLHTGHVVAGFAVLPLTGVTALGTPPKVGPFTRDIHIFGVKFSSVIRSSLAGEAGVHYLAALSTVGLLAFGAANLCDVLIGEAHPTADVALPAFVIFPDAGNLHVVAVLFGHFSGHKSLDHEMVDRTIANAACGILLLLDLDGQLSYHAVTAPVFGGIIAAGELTYLSSVLKTDRASPNVGGRLIMSVARLAFLFCHFAQKLII